MTVRTLVREDVSGVGESAATTSRRGNHLRRNRLGLHVAVLAALTLALAPVANVTGASWIDDEGAYGVQALSLLDGRWDYDYAGASFDPEGRWFPVARAHREGNRYFPYVQHPVYPVLLAGSARVFGTGVGIYLVPMLGLVLAAAVAWLLAAEVEPRASPVAFWLTAVSPLLVNAYIIWAHTLSAAVAGAALLMALRVLRRGLTPRRALGFAAALAFGILLRSEAVLFAIALTVALAGALAYRAYTARVQWRRLLRRAAHRRHRRPSRAPSPPEPGSARAAFFVGLAGVSASLGAVVFERWLAARIVGGGGAGASLATRDPIGESTAGEYLTTRAKALWRVTFSGSERFADASLPILIAVVLALLIALRWRRPARVTRPRPVLVAAAGAAAVAIAALYAWRIASYPDESASGLFAAWPVALVGLVALPWRRLHLAEGLMIAVLVLFGAAVYATQYSIGGAGEWGGRFLSPVVPGLATLVAVGLVRRADLAPLAGSLRRAAAVLAATVLLAPAVQGVWMVHALRARDEAFISDLRSVATRLVVIDSPGGVHWTLPKRAWRLESRHDFLLATPPDAPELLRRLHAAGVGEVTLMHSVHDPVLETSPFADVEDVTPDWLRVADGRIHILRRGSA